MYVRKRGNAWACQVSWLIPDPNNPGKSKRKYKTKSGFSTKAQAKVWGREQEIAMVKAGIKKKGFHFHSLRHCHVAYLASRHVDWYVISKRLGHADVAFTMRQYSYLIDKMKSQGEDYVADVLSDLDTPKNIKII